MFETIKTILKGALYLVIVCLIVFFMFGPLVLAVKVSPYWFFLYSPFGLIFLHALGKDFNRHFYGM